MDEIIRIIYQYEDRKKAIDIVIAVLEALKREKRFIIDLQTACNMLRLLMV